MVLGKYLAREFRVLLKDYDDTRQLTDLVRSMTGDDDQVTRNLRLANDEVEATGWRRRSPDMVLIDAEPARGPRTWQALRESEFVIVPAPPEGLAVRAMRQMSRHVERGRLFPRRRWRESGVRSRSDDWPEPLVGGALAECAACLDGTA